MKSWNPALNFRSRFFGLIYLFPDFTRVLVNVAVAVPLAVTMKFLKARAVRSLTFQLSTRSGPGGYSRSFDRSRKPTTVAPPAYRLRGLLTRPFVTSVILGAKHLDQLEDNLAAVDVRLTEDEIKQLDDVSALPPEYPGWMVAFQGGSRLQPAPAYANKQGPARGNVPVSRSVSSGQRRARAFGNTRPWSRRRLTGSGVITQKRV